MNPSILASLKEYRAKFAEELDRYVIPFWLDHSPDPVYGGVYTCLDREGKLYSSDKSVWMQGRAGYTFSLLYNEWRRDPRYLAYAKSAIDFATAHCIDRADGRMYFTVTKEGKPLRKRRYFFSETFYIIACAEYYRATGDGDCRETALRYYDFVWNIYLDRACDPYKITPKTIAETRTGRSLAEPMILLNVTAVLRRAFPERRATFDERAARLTADIFLHRKGDYMLETVTAEGGYLAEASSMRVVNPGHSIELSWFLLDEGEYRADPSLKAFAREVFDHAFAFGWDERYGGLLYFRDYEGRPVEAYEHDMKLWWPHNEAMIASLKMLRDTGEEKYFDVFTKVTDYTFAHFPDHEYGEWYGYLRRDGLPTEPPCKGHTYKGPFHVLRALLLSIQTIDGILADQNARTGASDR